MAAGLEQEPDAAFGFVDPDFDQAGSGHIVVLIANVVGFAQTAHQVFVVFTQLGEHVVGLNVVGVVVLDSLQASDMSDRANRRLAELADALGNRIAHGEDLVALLIQQQVIVAEVRAAHVPMEILGLEVQGEDIGQDGVHRARDIFSGALLQIRGGIQGSHLTAFKGGSRVSRFFHRQYPFFRLGAWFGIASVAEPRPLWANRRSYQDNFTIYSSVRWQSRTPSILIQNFRFSDHRWRRLHETF